MPVAMEGNEGSIEEQEDQMKEAIAGRIQKMDAQLGKLGILKSH